MVFNVCSREKQIVLKNYYYFGYFSCYQKFKHNYMKIKNTKKCKKNIHVTY